MSAIPDDYPVLPPDTPGADGQVHTLGVLYPDPDGPWALDKNRARYWQGHCECGWEGPIRDEGQGRDHAPFGEPGSAVYDFTVHHGQMYPTVSPYRNRPEFYAEKEQG